MGNGGVLVREIIGLRFVRKIVGLDRGSEEDVIR